MQQKQSFENWKQIVLKMQQQHGLWQINKEDLKVILNYLSKYFGPEKTAEQTLTIGQSTPLPK